MNNYIDINNLINANDKIKMYKSEEDIIFSEINKNFENIKYSYNTSNLENILKIENELLLKFSTISKIHNNNVTVINKNILKYIELSKKTVNIFENIDVGK